MKRSWRWVSMVFVAGLMLAAGCESHRPYVAADLPASKAAEGRPTLGMPVVLHESEWVLVPFALERPLGRFEMTSSYGASAGYMSDLERGLFYFRPRGVTWHNLVFRHEGSGEERLLLDRRAVITRFAPLGERSREETPVKPDLLFFGIAEGDTNGDGYINESDAIRGYVSDLEGRNLRAVTPAGTQFWQVGYRPEAGVLYFVVVEDTDGDKRFTTDDTPRLMRYGLRDGELTPLVTPETVRQAESLLAK